MNKKNRRLSQALLLSAIATLSGHILPAQARVDGADVVLDNCVEAGIEFLEKCDPNADVVEDASNLPNNMPGLSGSFNIRPLGIPAGLALEGTGLVDPITGIPLNNIDFSGPSQLHKVSGNLEFNPEADTNAVGDFDILSSTGDFDNLLGWSGTIKDLQVLDVGGLIGETVPGTEENPRIRDFMVINQPGEPGTGIIDGLEYGGVALDLVSLSSPSYDPVNGANPQTSISWQMVLQAYKLDSDGNRIEEQESLPGNNVAIYTNEVNARLSAAVDIPPDQELENILDEPGELLAWYGYDMTFDSQPIAPLFPIIEPGQPTLGGTNPQSMPEPTSIISSLLLLGGGVFKLARRDR